MKIPKNAEERNFCLTAMLLPRVPAHWEAGVRAFESTALLNFFNVANNNGTESVSLRFICLVQFPRFFLLCEEAPIFFKVFSKEKAFCEPMFCSTSQEIPLTNLTISLLSVKQKRFPSPKGYMFGYFFKTVWVFTVFAKFVLNIFKRLDSSCVLFGRQLGPTSVYFKLNHDKVEFLTFFSLRFSPWKRRWKYFFKLLFWNSTCMNFFQICWGISNEDYSITFSSSNNCCSTWRKTLQPQYASRFSCFCEKAN